MIKLHRLNGTEVILNSDLIESIDNVPDTIINLSTGNRYVVKETMDEIRKQIIEYKKQICASLMDNQEPSGEKRD